MATEAQQALKISGECSADLAALSTAQGTSTGQYTFVTLATTASATHFAIGQIVQVTSASAAPGPIGVLQNKPTAAGQMCEIVVIGVTKILATTGGTTITTVADFIGPHTDGTAQKVVGTTGGAVAKWVCGRIFNQGPGLQATVPAAGDITRAVINCVNPYPATS